MANILIVDDSRTSRKILRRILEEAEHTIVGEAVNGEDGYLKYQELKPDVVTLDITMPKMDGLEGPKPYCVLSAKQSKTLPRWQRAANSNSAIR